MLVLYQSVISESHTCITVLRTQACLSGMASSCSRMLTGTHLLTHSSCSDKDLSLWEWHVVPKSVKGDREFFCWNSCISHYQLLVVAETLVTGMPFVVCASPNVHTPPEHTQLHWLPVQGHISYKIACLGFSSINSSTPNYLSDIRHLCSPSRSLRPDITTLVDWV